MAIKYFLAPNARWQGRDNTGQPVINGKLYTYITGTQTPKATYQDYQGSNPNTNPVTLDGKGEANIYWANDQLYTIVLKDANGNTVYTQDNYPTVDSNSSTVQTVTVTTNFVRNPQFTYWNNGTSFSPAFNSVNRYDYVADDWIFERSNTTATIEVSRQTFPIDQTIVPGNPLYYLHFNCTAGGSGETYRRLSQYYSSVRTLAGKTVVLSFWAQSSSSSQVSVTLRQYFGTGGSPSATVTTTLLATTNLTSSWVQYTASVTVPVLSSSQSIGSNNDDALIFDFNFTTNSSAIVDLASVQLQLGDTTTLTSFPYFTPNDQFKKMDSTENESLWSTGDYKHTLATTAPAGWVLCDDGTIGSPQSGASHALVRCKALYDLIWAGVSDTYAPVTGGRGASSTADWNASKPMALTRALGRALSGYNPSPTSIVSKTFTASSSSGLLLTVNDATSFYTGVKVRVSNSGGALPTGLAAATDYYCVNISGTTLKLATSLANAIAGTVIAYTDAGSGTNTVFTQNAAHTLGSYLGEDTHALTKPEMPVHNHPFPAEGNNPNGDYLNPLDPGSIYISGATTLGEVRAAPSAGGSTAHNIIQPTLYTNVMLKL